MPLPVACAANFPLAYGCGGTHHLPTPVTSVPCGNQLFSPAEVWDTRNPRLQPAAVAQVWRKCPSCYLSLESRVSDPVKHRGLL